MLYPNFLANVGNILSLPFFFLLVQALPVIGHGEDGVGSVDGGLERVFGVQVSLSDVSKFSALSRSALIPSRNPHPWQPEPWPLAWMGRG